MGKHSLKDYKEAIILTEHLDAILKVLNLTERGLEHFKLYIPVAKVLHTIKDQKSILEVHYEKAKRVKESKGKS